MVFNDDLSYQEEVEAGFYRADHPLGGLSYLLARVAALGRPVRRYDYTRSLSELLKLNDACHQRGQKFAVVIFRNDTWAPWLKLVAAVRTALSGTGIPMLDLGTVLQGDRHDERDLHVHAIDRHPNELAHRLAAGEIERFLHDAGMQIGRASCRERVCQYV